MIAHAEVSIVRYLVGQINVTIPQGFFCQIRLIQQIALQGAGYDRMGYEEAREIVKENIEYDILVQDPRQDREQLDEVVDLIAETLCSRKKTIVIAGDEYRVPVLRYSDLRLLRQSYDP